MDIIILILATYRITHLLVNESGPRYYLDDFRAWLGIYYDENNLPKADNLIGEAFTCMYCLSFWIGLILSGTHWYSPNLSYYLLLPFALSGGVIVIKEIIK